jgi:hypothetical protein
MPSERDDHVAHFRVTRHDIRLNAVRAQRLRASRTHCGHSNPIVKLPFNRFLCVKLLHNLKEMAYLDLRGECEGVYLS